MLFVGSGSMHFGFVQVSIIIMVNMCRNQNSSSYYCRVEWLVLDEADKLFEEGTKSFREQFDQIFQACSNEQKKVALFSATWANPVVKWARKNVKQLLTVTIGQRNSATDTVQQELVFVGNEAGKLIAFRNLVQKGLKPPVLVFVDSKVRSICHEKNVPDLIQHHIRIQTNRIVLNNYITN